MKKTQYTLIGGDKRQKQVAAILARKGFLVRIFGLDIRETHENIEKYSELDPELFQSQVIMLPIPYKNQKGGIHMIEQKTHLSPETLFSLMKPDTIVIYGKEDQEIADLCRQYSIHGYDIVKEESFSILNAIPTAEGAIQRAMERMDITLHGSRVLILGYGRIGRVLSRMLRGIGADVSVEARSWDDLAWIEESGYHAVPLSELDSVLGEQNIIINTIPAMILDRTKLERVGSDCTIIDLASHPGGVDFEAATEYGLSASLDLGLPGFVAPKTAARIICQVANEIVTRYS